MPYYDCNRGGPFEDWYLQTRKCPLFIAVSLLGSMSPGGL